MGLAGMGLKHPIWPVSLPADVPCMCGDPIAGFTDSSGGWPHQRGMRKAAPQHYFITYRRHLHADDR